MPYTLSLMIRRTTRGIWDLDPRRLNLRKPHVLRWYVTRKIHAGDWAALDRPTLARLLPSLRLDRHLKSTLAHFLRSDAIARHPQRTTARAPRRSRR